MMNNDEISVRTGSVALVELFYRDEYVTSIVFDRSRTADLFVSTMQPGADRSRGFTFRRRVESVYDADTIGDELIETQRGADPQGTLSRVVRLIERDESP